MTTEPAFACGLSEHPLTAHAVGEVTGQVLEALGEQPDLALIFVTPPHAGALEDAARAVASLLKPQVLLGCAAVSVAGTRKEVEGGPAVSLWAARLGAVAPVRLDAFAGELMGWPPELPFEPRALVLVGDPFTFPADRAFDSLERSYPGLPLIGGMASAAQGPGGNRLVLDDATLTTGAVGAFVGPAPGLTTVVSQGCRPVGHPMTVTKSEGNIVYELAGRPALERLTEMARATMSEEQVSLINSGGLHLGLVIDEHKEEFSRGDFLIRNVLGADRTNGAIAVGDVVELGTTVQFQLRDAGAADEDLRSMLGGRSAKAALLFTCNGRGVRLFGEPHHDANAVADELGDVPLAGFFAAGEFGPVGHRNFLHGFTASLALFGGDSPRGG